MRTFLIIADDLTGAADTAARCHHAGWPATIAVTPPQAPPAQGVLAVNTDSRHLDAADAAQRIQAICAPLAAANAARGGVTWYKKIDSTLRGNLGAELDALMAVCGAPVALVCPAFPAQQRGLENGELVYAGASGRRVHLPTLLRRQSVRSIASVALRDVRAGVDALAVQLRTQQSAGHTVLVVDAMDEHDLETLRAAAAAALPDVLFCGSAGLIGVLAAAASPPLPTVPMPSSDFRSALLVVGSGSAMARAQVEAVAASHAGVHKVIVGDGDGSLPWLPADGETTPVTLLHLPAPTPGVPLDGPAARVLAAQLGDVALHFVGGVHPDIVILVGGDTAIALLTRLGVTELEVTRELLPGIPLTRAPLSDGTPLHVVLKAGNHGQVDTLLQLLSLLSV